MRSCLCLANKINAFKFPITNMVRLVLIPFVILMTPILNAQVKSTHVINSAGSIRQASGLKLTDNIGEPFIVSVKNGNSKITQGFLQPMITGKLGFNVSILFQSLKCTDKVMDAFISLSVTPSIASQTVTYLWTPQSICPANNCAKIDSLTPGVYNVQVVVAYKENTGKIVRDTIRPQKIVIENASSPCLVKVYRGITANGDGLDDVLQIDNITEFPDNRVSVYSRWGDLLFDVKGYDEKDPARSWPVGSSKNRITSGTYFYVIELGKGYAAIKGWVELMKD
jgi:gliding motility-associated-like protein